MQPNPTTASGQVLSNAQLASLNRTADIDSYETTQQMSPPCPENMKTSYSAPEFDISSTSSGINEMDVVDTNEPFSVRNDNCVAVGNMPIAECDRMIHTKLCYPASCNMYHHHMI